jgi:hypothetical protein
MHGNGSGNGVGGSEWLAATPFVLCVACKKFPVEEELPVEVPFVSRERERCYSLRLKVHRVFCFSSQIRYILIAIW